MKLTLLNTSLAVILVWCTMATSLKAQTLDRYVVSSAGSTLAAGGNWLNFTIGEPIAVTFQQEEELSQGFQQEWVTITAVDDPATASFDAKVYPNPTIGAIHIEMDDQAQARLFDPAGRLVLAREIEPGDNLMNMAGLQAGPYVLVLQRNSKQKVRSYRIIKLE